MVVCAFFAICFAQSSLDKILDYRGNLAYLEEHFAATPMKAVVPGMLVAITIFEAATALASLLAVVTLLVGFTGIMPTLALSLAAVTLLMLFGGQRFSKDYAGAGTLGIYFGVAVIGLLAIGLPR
jgi:hypothetical protein